MPLDQDLVKRNFLGKDGFIWWIGQIPEEANYVENQTGRREEPGTVNGPGERYKVRIFGYHEIECGQPELPDADLPWATVMYPVTAGGGGGAASQSANLTQGTMVYGFFLDGHDAQQPVIMGVLGYNQTSFSPVERYISDTCNKGQPFDGYGPEDKIPLTHIKESPEEVIDPVTKEPSSGPSEKVNQPGSPTSTITKASAISEDVADTASNLEKEDSEDPSALKQPQRCNKDDGQQGIKTELMKHMREIQRLQSLAQGWVAAVNGEVEGVQERIQKIIESLTTKIVGFVKSIINKVRGFAIRTIENLSKDAYTLVFPNQDQKLNQAQNKIMDTLSCLFDKIIAGLMDLVGGILGDVADSAVNTTECLVSGMMGNILGNVLGGIVSGIQGILDSVSSVIGAIGGAAAGAVGAILGFIENILQFGAAFSCQEDYSCSETEEWSIGKGIESISEFGSEMADTAKGIIDSIAGVGEAAGSAVDGILGSFSQNGGSCDVGPIASGPPTIKVIGGGGEGAEGNAIIGDDGEILAVEITNPGSGYVTTPKIAIQDPTGAGTGAFLQGIIGLPDGPDGGGTQPGDTGVPDGGVGGGDEDDDSDNNPSDSAGDNDQDDDGDGSKTVINEGDTVKVTPFRPNPGDTVCIEWSSEGKTVINNNFGAGESQMSGRICIENFTQPKTFIITTSDDEDTTTTTIRVVPKGTDNVNVLKDIKVVNPGYGYLKESDGSLGANGRQWASRCDTYYIDPNGRFSQPIAPGNVITIPAGSQLYVPSPVTGYGVESDDEKDVDDGVSQDTIFTPGGLQNVNSTVTITTPKCPPPKDGDELADIGFGTGGDTEGDPSTGDGKYGVRLCVKQILIENAGVNFDPSDEIYLEPDHGTKLSMELGPYGSIAKITVVQKGCGFTRVPKVRINTRTGFNQELIPLFEVQRIGEADLENLALRALDRDNRGIISVVDCVNNRYKRPDPSGSSADSGYYEKGKPNAAVKALD
tara:strand:- start:1559 stop:4510 length:2952 start_codon:yes stop_codon:yes gene_type:complete